MANKKRSALAVVLVGLICTGCGVVGGSGGAKAVEGRWTGKVEMTPAEIDEMLVGTDPAQRSIYDSLMDDYSAAIEINGDGTYKAQVGMNDFDGTWSLEDESLTLVVQTKSSPYGQGGSREEVKGSETVLLTLQSDGEKMIGVKQGALDFPKVAFTKSEAD